LFIKKGVDNRVADALSHMAQVFADNVDFGGCNAMSSCQSKWVEEVEHSYATNPSSQVMIAKLVVDGEAVPHFS
jgi:hypothetical protein